jgi:hypothetical protein
MQWVAEIADVRRRWEAQVPDQKVAWAATDEAANAAAVTFTNLGGGQTSLHLWSARYARLHARPPTGPSDRPGVLVRSSVRPAPRGTRRWARMPAC